jgi:hypothetical protein
MVIMTTDDDDVDTHSSPIASLVGRPPRKQVPSVISESTKLQDAIALVAEQMEKEMMAYDRIIRCKPQEEKEKITDVEATLQDVQEKSSKIYKRDAECCPTWMEIILPLTISRNLKKNVHTHGNAKAFQDMCEGAWAEADKLTNKKMSNDDKEIAAAKLRQNQIAASMLLQCLHNKRAEGQSHGEYVAMIGHILEMQGTTNAGIDIL